MLRRRKAHAIVLVLLAIATVVVALQDLAPHPPRLIDLSGFATGGYFVAFAIALTAAVASWRRDGSPVDEEALGSEPSRPMGCLALLPFLIAAPMLLLFVGYEVMTVRDGIIAENDRAWEAIEEAERSADGAIVIERWWTTPSVGEDVVLSVVLRARAAGSLRMSAYQNRGGPREMYSSSLREHPGIAYGEYEVAAGEPTTLRLVMHRLESEPSPGTLVGQPGDLWLDIHCEEYLSISFMSRDAPEGSRLELPLPPPSPPPDEPSGRAEAVTATWGPDEQL